MNNASKHFSIWTRAKQRWMVFLINYQWSSWVQFIDGWISKFALFFPIVGYLILFNDGISDFFSFSNLADEKILESGLSGKSRLRLLYFGLLFLGISNFIYRFKRPHVLRLGNNRLEYAEAGFKYFTLGDYVGMHGSIRHNGHSSLDGKYYDSEWEGFLAASKNSGEGTEKVKRNGNWENAKKQYGSLLRSILRDTFSYYSCTKRTWLTLCIILSTIGYLLVLTPSLDIFIKVVRSTLS